MGEPLRDPEGKIVQWYGLSLDIDQQKRAEDHLREMRAKLGGWALGWRSHARLWRRTMGDCGPRKIQEEERDSICVCPEPMGELPHKFADVTSSASLSLTPNHSEWI